MSLFYTPGFRMLCVDPGLRGCGVAEFVGGNLARAAYVPNTERSGRGYVAQVAMGKAVWVWCGPSGDGFDRVVIEHPRVYPGSAQQKGDLNDLLDVTGVGAAVASMFSPTPESVFPSEWKGSVPANIMTERIKRSCTQEEKAGVEKCAASLAHNLWDAVGIGLYKLSRLHRKVLHE